jgi:ribose 5-phosphate isomerase B
MKRIAIGSDHAGYKLKERIKSHLKSKAYTVVDYGTNSDEPVDYPDYIRPAAESVSNGEIED